MPWIARAGRSLLAVIGPHGDKGLLRRRRLSTARV